MTRGYVAAAMALHHRPGMKKIIFGLLALLALGSTVGDAQTTLPPNTVLGRLGIGPGPAQAIPFATLNAQLNPTSLSVTLFGALCDYNGTTGTDDSAAFNAAVAYADSIGGAKIVVPPRKCAIANTVVINKPRIWFVGSSGVEGQHDVGGDTVIASKLYWTGSAGGTILQVTSIAGAGNQSLRGVGVQDLAFMGKSSAARGLDITNAKYSTFRNLYFEEFTNASLFAWGQPNLGEVGGTCQNVFENILSKNATSSGAGIWLDADTTGATNTCLNTFNLTSVIMRNGVGIKLGYADNNLFLRTFVFHATDGTADAISFLGPTGTQPIGAQANTFVGLTVGNKNGTGGNVHAYTGSEKNGIFAYDSANASPTPIIDAGVSFTYQYEKAPTVESTGITRFGQNGNYSGTVSFAGSTSGVISAVPQAAAGTYNWNWPTTSGSSGNLLFSGGGGATAMDWSPCVANSTADIVCSSASAFHPQYSMTNSTNDANSSAMTFQKNRAAGNTSASDTLGQLVMKGFANSAQQNAVTMSGVQDGAVSGSNVPARFQVQTSNAAGQLNQSLLFNSAAHLSTLQATAPTITAGCTGAGSAVGTGSTDLHGTITGSTAAVTTCTITFGTAFNNTPHCVTSGQTSPLTGAMTPSTTTLVVNFASTANYKWSYVCMGS